MIPGFCSQYQVNAIQLPNGYRQNVSMQRHREWILPQTFITFLFKMASDNVWIGAVRECIRPRHLTLSRLSLKIPSDIRWFRSGLVWLYRTFEMHIAIFDQINVWIIESNNSSNKKTHINQSKNHFNAVHLWFRPFFFVFCRCYL